MANAGLKLHGDKFEDFFCAILRFNSEFSATHGYRQHKATCESWASGPPQSIAEKHTMIGRKFSKHLQCTSVYHSRVIEASQSSCQGETTRKTRAETKAVIHSTFSGVDVLSHSLSGWS